MILRPFKKIHELKDELARQIKNNTCLQELNALKQAEIKGLKNTIKSQNKELKKLRYIVKVNRSFK